MENLLISACLMGADCKYSGGNNKLPEQVLRQLREKYRLIPVCPELAGGLSVPRRPAERMGSSVVSDKGEDVTAQYRLGARLTAALAGRLRCTAALLKENSPSCGCGSIYDGSFSHRLISGDGVTAETLKAMGIRVLGESKLSELL